MIEVIKQGTTRYKIKCRYCGCIYTFERDDITGLSFAAKVRCPDCKEPNYLGNMPSEYAID